MANFQEEILVVSSTGRQDVSNYEDGRNKNRTVKSIEGQIALYRKNVTSFSLGLYILQMCLAFLHPMGFSLNIYVLEYFTAL